MPNKKENKKMEEIREEIKEALVYTLRCVLFVIDLYVYAIKTLPAVVIGAVIKGLKEAEAMDEFLKRKRLESKD